MMQSDDRQDLFLGLFSDRTVLYAKLVMTAIFWGGTFVAGRIVAAEAGPFSAAFLRFLIASTVLLGFVIHTEGRLPQIGRLEVLPVIALGLTGVFFYNAFFFSGLKVITAGRASLIIATNPVFIALFASLLFKEQMGTLKALGICISVLGAAIVISRGNLSDLFSGQIGTGELFIFGCVASWVTYSLVGKIVMKRLAPLIAVTYSCAIGTACLAFPAYYEGVLTNMPHYSSGTWLSLLYLGLLGSAVGFIWYYQGIKVIGASRAGVFINIVPVSAIILAALILHEAVDASLVVGVVFVSAGVYCTNRTRQPAKEVDPPQRIPAIGERASACISALKTKEGDDPCL